MNKHQKLDMYVIYIYMYMNEYPALAAYQDATMTDYLKLSIIKCNLGVSLHPCLYPFNDQSLVIVLISTFLVLSHVFARVFLLLMICLYEATNHQPTR